MASVTTHGRALHVGREAVWLVSGALHYFRVPQTLWRDRLQKAKWAGLNTIDTPVPWNWHETKPGKFDFKKDCDLEGFLKTAGDLGLYAIVRVGPYIGSDWEFGGLPADIAGESNSAVREADPKFLKRVEDWFDELLPRLAKLQPHHGGNVILLAAEHEYFHPDRPRGEAYLSWLVKQIRGRKIDVPILGSSHFHVHTKGVLETWSDGEDAVNGLARLGQEQPGQPRLVLGLPPGAPDRWSSDRRGLKSPRQSAAQALRVLAEGGMYNWTPFVAGTNFGFWAGRSPRDDASFLTTSYDCDAAVTECGGLTSKYYAIKSVNQLAGCLSAFLPAAEPARLKTDLPTGFTLVARKSSAGPSGTMLFVFRDDGITDQWADLGLAGGVTLPLDFTHQDGLALAYDLTVGKKIHIEYCNCPLLGTWQDRFVFFHGPAGSQAVVSLNGKLHEFNIPTGPALEWREAAEGHFLVFMDTATAEATWFDPERGVVIGAALPGEKPARAIESVAGEGVVSIGKDANPVRTAARAAPPPRPPRRVGNWRRLADIPEIRGEGDGWKRLSGPSDAVGVGVPRGYIWYRAKFKLERKRTVTLFLPGAEDRVHLWSAGKPLGIWGRGPGAVREPLAADFEPGDNVITALVDNLGRFSRRTPLTDTKGLFEHIYHGNALHLSEPIRSTPASLPKEIKATWTVERTLNPDPARMSLCEMHFSQPQGANITLEIRQLPEPCWVFVNDVYVGFFHGRHAGGFCSWTIPSPNRPLNHLRIYFASQHQRSIAERFRVCDLAENLTENADWAFKPWGPPDPAGDRWSRELKDDQKLRWYSAQFPEIKAEEPVLLNLTGLGKGQILLNGHNVGRYWGVGPQTRFFVPDAWLTKNNELLIFEEEGKIPNDVQLEFDPTGPFGDPHAAAAEPPATPSGKNKVVAAK